ncbi:MAG TPA: methyltransferase [Ardenticatenaceae bacterium]|nr:methyltransferase [Ardenticatenaceae bacterium]
MSDYYEWRPAELTLLEEDETILMRPGLPDSDPLGPAAGLLVDEATVEATDRVLVVEPNSGALSLAAVRQATEGRVDVLCGHAAVLAATERNLREHSATNATIMPSDLCSAVLEGGRQYDVLLATLPKGKAAINRLIMDAATLLRSGGHFFLAGGNDEGIKSAAKRLEQAFGNAVVVAYRKGHRLVQAVAPEHSLDSGQLEDEGYYTFREMVVPARGQEWRVITKPGIFSWDRLDPATALLLEQLSVKPGARLLDLGAGYGIIGLVAARLAPQGWVDLVEAEVAGVEASRRTLEINSVRNAAVHLSDAAEAVRREYDAVVTNPPFHQGHGVDYSVARQFIRDAYRLLVPGGSFWLVSNRNLRVNYSEIIRHTFDGVTVVHEDSRWQLLRASR